MIKKNYPYYLANRPVTANSDLKVTDKFTGEVVTSVAQADSKVIDQAIAHAVQAAGPMAKLAAYERKEILLHCVKKFTERADEFAEALCIEAGKPIKDSRGEVTRLIETFQVAAEESVRQVGEVLPLDISARTRGYSGFWKRFPIGPCSFISPFNFPLNLVAHKVAPAIAVGNSFVLKPASRTPIGALLIGEVLSETKLPPGAFSILPCSRDGAELFTTDPRLKCLSFTGSPAVGWDLKAKAGKKKVILELGGNAACVVEPGVDLEDAVKRILSGAFYQSGQSCISVQRILINEAIYSDVRGRLVEGASKLKSGNPQSEDTFIGPVISEKEAERIEGWIDSAVKRGAKILCGGQRRGSMIEATLLEGVPTDEKLYAKEVFGPVAILESYRNFDDALRTVNRSDFGLQVGIFTRDLNQAMLAWERLEVGGVIINDVPSWRVDHMPYGGVKDSGLGREGIRFAMEEMTEIRLLAIRNSDQS